MQRASTMVEQDNDNAGTLSSSATTTTILDAVVEGEPSQANDDEGEEELLRKQHEHEASVELERLNPENETPSTTTATNPMVEQQHRNGSGGDRPSQTGDDDDDDDDDEEDTVDPFAFPKTTKGVEAFLSAIDGHEKEAEDVLQSMTYQANSVLVEASSTLEVPIPILMTKTKTKTASNNTQVDWEVKVETLDIDFHINLVMFNEETGEEVETTMDEAFPLTSSRSVTGNFTIPAPQTLFSKAQLEDDVDNDAATTATTATTGITDDDVSSSTTTTTAAPVVVDPSKVSTKLVLIFGNGFSWFTSKRVSYAVTITQPVVEERKIRRAQKALKPIVQRMIQTRTILEQQRSQSQQYQQVLHQERSVLESLHGQVTTAQQVVEATALEVEHAQQTIQELQTARDEAFERLQSERQQMAELERRMRELQLEHQVRVEETKVMEAQLAEQDGWIQKAKAEKEAKSALRQRTLLDMQDTTQQLQQRQKEVSQIQQDYQATVEQEKKMLSEVEYLTHVESALKVRTEKKTTTISPIKRNKKQNQT